MDKIVRVAGEAGPEAFLETRWKKSPDTKLLAALRDARPAWAQNSGGVRSLQPTSLGSSAVQTRSKDSVIVVRRDETEFPEPSTASQTTTEEATPTAAENEYSFRITLKEIHQDRGTVEVFIDYGEIDGVPPEDMTSDTDFTFELDVAGDEIYAEIGYDENTLAIGDDPSDRTLEFAPEVPASELGILRVPIGFVDWEINGTSGLIEKVICHNRYCGDINPQFIVGEFNGIVAIYPLATLSNPVALED